MAEPRRDNGDPAPVDADVPVRAVPRIHRHALDTVRGRWDILVVISVGGAVGSLARWSLGGAMPARGGRFPWATLTENLTGALVLGLIMVLVGEIWPTTRYVRPFLGVGVLGGYTTFSTYMLDTHGLIGSGSAGLAVVYLAGTLLGGLLAVALGIIAARVGVALAVNLARRAGQRH